MITTETRTHLTKQIFNNYKNNKDIRVVLVKNIQVAYKLKTSTLYNATCDIIDKTTQEKHTVTIPLID